MSYLFSLNSLRNRADGSLGVFSSPSAGRGGEARLMAAVFGLRPSRGLGTLKADPCRSLEPINLECSLLMPSELGEEDSFLRS